MPSFPDADEPDPASWFTNLFVSALNIKAHIIDRLNLLRLFGRGFINEAYSASSVTLSGTTDNAGLARVTFTLASQRRVKISVMATLNPATTSDGHYEVQAAYNTGSTVAIGSVVNVGMKDSIATGTNLRFRAGKSFGTAVLPAGTYIAYGRELRGSGGATTDVFNEHYVLVEDLGAS